jgi:LacI family transcriptional regulator
MGKNARKRDRKPTIIDVAKAASVSVMTVSRVLNKHPSVRASSTQKVMSAIARVGYVQNDAARILKGARARTIGLIVPDLTDFYATCFHAVQEVAMRHQHQTLVAATGRDGEVENEHIASMNARRISGLILVTSGGDRNRIEDLIESGVSVVALDRPIAGVKVDAVLVENEEGAEAGTRHLIEHKHKRIACLTSGGNSYTTRQRSAGYQRAMREAGLKPAVISVPTLERMKALIAEWEKDRNRPTAVFTTKRITSIQLIQALHRSALSVPRDLAIAGFDDFELAEVIGTPLTVVSQDPSELARSAAELLFRHLDESRAETRSAHPPVKMVFPTRLVIRASCGCRLSEP